MTNWQSRLAWPAGLAAILIAMCTTAAEEPAVKIGLNVGEQMPFFVVDFCSGEIKGAGCPGVIVSNHKAKGVLILARTPGEGALELAKSLETKVIDGQRVLGFVINIGAKDPALGTKCEAAGLKLAAGATVRDQSLATLKKLGLADEIDVAVFFLDRKAVQGAHLLKAGEFTAEKRKELLSAAEKWAATE